MVLGLDEYMIFNKKMLRLVGLYPMNLLRYLICISSILLIVVPQIYQLYVYRYDIPVILETSSVFLTIILTILKSFVWLRNNETTKLVEFLLTDYWQIAISSDLKNRMPRYATSGRNVTRGYFFLIINAILLFFFFQPLKIALRKFRGDFEDRPDELKHFPFPATYPTFCYESPFYELTYGSQTLATTVCGLLILAMDALIATALFHTCGHLKILQDNLRNLDEYIKKADSAKRKELSGRTKYSRELSNDVNKRLADIIDHHQIIIRFSDSMEKAFNPILFLQVFGSSLIICLVGFQVSSTTSKNYRLVEYFSYLMMALCQILLFCWPGEEFICHGMIVADAAFSIKWYDASNYVKMATCLIILRSQRPNCLTAGKFYRMRMESFVTILNTAFSYLMLLRNINSN